jgi:acyl-CoA hydrolase/GNAT superfamily N-acetyltransferase
MTDNKKEPMQRFQEKTWQDRVVTPDEVMTRIDSGMSIFIGTGPAEPRALVNSLVASEAMGFKDLELIQLISFGDIISSKALGAKKYRLKTFFSGWPAAGAIRSGLIDLIPSRFSRIPRLIESGRIGVDAAMIQVSPPNEAGYCSMGIAVDVARQVMAQASLVIGEINPQVPVTYGDTFLPVSEFDFLVRSESAPISFERCPVDNIIDRVAANVSALIEDGSCMAFSVGPVYEALGRYLSRKKNLGIHSPFFSDVMMDLVKNGAVTNRNKETHPGKSLTSYAIGTPELMKWLHRNPLVEFHPIDAVFNPVEMGRNRRFVAVLPAHKVDLSGRVVLNSENGRLSVGPEEAIDMFNGAELSKGGRTIFALPSRDSKGISNIRMSVDRFSNLFTLRETVDIVVTEYGAASLAGRTVRERAQALIDIAHPDDRLTLVEKAKEKNVLYPDQIFLAECARRDPSEIETVHVFKGDVKVRFRAIRPSDEEEMRRLFYRFSDEAVYHRYFSPVSSMPHEKMQAYVNADCNAAVSIVGEIGDPNRPQIIAEARFVKLDDRPYGEVAFVVDESCQSIGIASYLFKMLARLAKNRGLKGFTADVLASNRAMMHVFEKRGHPVTAKLFSGVYQLVMPFDPEK